MSTGVFGLIFDDTDHAIPVCPACGSVMDVTDIEEGEGKVWIRVRCPSCGYTTARKFTIGYRPKARFNSLITVVDRYTTVYVASETGDNITRIVNSVISLVNALKRKNTGDNDAED